MAEYKKTWDLFFAYHQAGQAFDFEELRIWGDDTRRLCGCHHALRLGHRMSGPSEPGGLQFRLTIGLRKVDGGWRIQHEHHSVPATEYANRRLIGGCNVCSMNSSQGRTNMPNSVHLHRVLATRPEKIYRAFVEADALAKWLPPNGFVCTVHHLEPKAGGTFKMSFRNFTTGKSHAFGGEYVDSSE